MKEYRLSRALTEIDDRYLDMVDRKEKEVHIMKQYGIRKKRMIRTILIAAVISALMGITAYALSTIHTARQQELRANLQIEENNVIVNQ